MIEDNLILVDDRDKKIGEAKKQYVHEHGLLHRAFSVFIFNEDGGDVELLLQRRELNKYHCGGLWTNTCCSHPRPGEIVLEAAARRLKEEMNLVATLTPVGSFIYKAEFSNGLIEHEYDHVVVGWHEKGVINYNKQEVAEVKWLSIRALQEDLMNNPDSYTPWFKRALDIALNYINVR